MAKHQKTLRGHRIKDPLAFFAGRGAIFLVAVLSSISSLTGIVCFLEPPTLPNIAIAAMAAGVMGMLSTFARVVHYAPANPVLVVVACLLDFLPWIMVVFMLAGKIGPSSVDDDDQGPAGAIQTSVDDILAVRAALEPLREDKPGS